MQNLKFAAIAAALAIGFAPGLARADEVVDVNAQTSSISAQNLTITKITFEYSNGTRATFDVKGQSNLSAPVAAAVSNAVGTSVRVDDSRRFFPYDAYNNALGRNYEAIAGGA